MVSPEHPRSSGAPRTAQESHGKANEPYVFGLVLLAIAGWVDAVGFVHWGGMFTSFMSGNTTQFGVAVMKAAPQARQLASVIASFIIGVAVGEGVRMQAGRWRRAVVMALESIVLAIAAIIAMHSSNLVILLLLSLAMGMQNAVIHRAEGIGIALTYVTGTLVHLGRAVTLALAGKDTWNYVFFYAGLWIALATGALAGGFTSGKSVPFAIAMACGAVAATAGFCVIRGPAQES